jgi:hypothetical protein
VLTIIFIFVFILPASYIFAKYSDFHQIKKSAYTKIFRFEGIQNFSENAGIDQSLNILYINIPIRNNPHTVINISTTLPFPYWTFGMGEGSFKFHKTSTLLACLG